MSAQELTIITDLQMYLLIVFDLILRMVKIFYWANVILLSGECEINFVYSIQSCLI